MLNEDQQSAIVDGIMTNTSESRKRAYAAFYEGAPELFGGGIGGGDGIDPDDLPTMLNPFTGPEQIPTVDPARQCDHVPGGVPFYNNQGGSAALNIIGADLKIHRLSGFIRDNTFLTWLAYRGGRIGTTERDIYNAAKSLYESQRKPLTRNQLLDL